MEISVEPGRDTPARLAAYSKEFGADWVLATGTPANLDALWKFFGVSVQIVPEEQPPRSTGTAARRSPTMSTTPTATS
jgi:cytochrome oxidase Cu insertion factor (SCO1/SenC/PrrC family)